MYIHFVFADRRTDGLRGNTRVRARKSILSNGDRKHPLCIPIFALLYTK